MLRFDFKIGGNMYDYEPYYIYGVVGVLKKSWPFG